MTEKLKDYQVIDVFCGGTFYKVRHKVTNNIFAWKAYNCSAYSTDQIQSIVNEVKTINKLSSDNVLRYYDTILHVPSKTLYFVLEYNSWRSLQELIDLSKNTDRQFAENFIWHLLHELARVYKAVEHVNVTVLKKSIAPASIFVRDDCQLRVNCFDLTPGVEAPDLMRQIGEVVRDLCFRVGACDDVVASLRYSTDLIDVVSFLRDDKNSNLRPDVVLYHPTVLSNLETQLAPKHINEILESAAYAQIVSEANKCDSEKVVQLTRTVEPLPRTVFNVPDSPIYCNVSPKELKKDKCDVYSGRDSLSPTLAALALELPGFVPRSRRPYSEALEPYNYAQQVSEETLTQQWMSRLVALRQREESLNKRERHLIAKEIVSSPSTKTIPLNTSQEGLLDSDSNGITLPPMITQAQEDRREWTSRRRRRRSGSVRSRGRRKSCGYEDLDSSLSADAGDGSLIMTATKYTKENMPRRNIFPDVSTKKVHFTSSNPFTESDESVTLTFYELDNADRDGYLVPRDCKDITKFKYLDSEKIISEKRAAMQWSHSSPSKQARMCKNVFSDISNHSSIRKTPSKSSLTSKGSNSSRLSMMSAKSQWSMDSCDSKVRQGGIFERTRSSMRQSLAQTPTAPPDLKKSKSRKSLLNFKTPFKFMSSTKI